MKPVSLISVAVLLVAALSGRSDGFFSQRLDSKMDLSGAACAVCTVITGMVEQMGVVHNETNAKAFARVCDLFPGPFRTVCGTFRLIYGTRIIRYLNQGETPDTTCIGVKFCDEPQDGQAMCHLFPSNLTQKSSAEVREYVARVMPESRTRVDPRAGGICDIPLIGTIICSVVNVQAFSMMYPKDDGDMDGFSDKFTLRGSAWRGKDCSDSAKPTYPGRRPAQDDLFVDSNCNGVVSGAFAGNSYEHDLCENSGARGVIAIGDSATANFHVPGEWFDATVATPDLYRNLSHLLDNSFNWPHTSFLTGYQNVDWPIIDGTTDSIYLRMRERNLCNHRDYQNIGVNGGRITDGPAFIQSIKRDPARDKPALAIFSMIGNDVCKYNADPTSDEVTTPAQAREYMYESLVQLNRKLPAGSHVMVVGVADARPFFDDIRSKIHPFGALRRDVRFADFYQWLDCLKINPCLGWLSLDENIRNITAQRVAALNIELQRVVEENHFSFPNFEVNFIPNPVNEVIAAWEANGGETWQLVEAFDGFHPNQKAHALIAGVVWNRLVQDFPNVIGEINPHNEQLRTLFGDQGGH